MSVVLLVAVAGLPVMATTCAALCEPAAAAPASVAGTSAADVSAPATSMHHGPDAACHEPSTSSDLRLTSAALHDCSTHDGARREAEATVTAARMDAWAPVTVTPFASTSLEAPSSNALGTPSAHGSPFISSAATTPLVLRV